MLSTTTKTEPVDDGVRCERCQHRVDVRGVEQIVCLAHLAVFSAARAGHCGYFEAKAPLPPRRRG